MIQDFDSQLQVALTALQDVVAPALADGEKHVVEQLMLSIMTIGFVKQRLPEARGFHRMELRGWIDLAKRAVNIAGGADDLTSRIEAGEAALADPEADIGAFSAAQRDLRDAITTVYSATTGEPYAAELEAAILDGHGALTQQNRLWLMPFGFEIQPETLPEPAW